MMTQASIRAIFQEISRCQRCILHTSRSMAVLPCGSLTSRIMVIAQSPGEQENRSGEMFCGPSGRIFYSLLREAGIAPSSLYLTNLVKCMLPGARRPRLSEMDTCAAFLIQEAAWLQPRLYVPLGFHATRWLLKKYGFPVPEKKEMHHLFGLLLFKKKVRIFPLRHPTALLFNPDKKRIMLKNYQRLQTLIMQWGEG